MASPGETAAMRRALDLAQSPGVPRGPNPRVGAVLLSPTGDVIAAGFHRGAGNAHAEVDVLTQAGDRARGATAVITLEPCNHTGRTGPCATALIDAGVTRVVFGQSEPNPVATGGAVTLTAAGVDVEAGLLAEEAAAVNETWSFAMRHQRPFVTLKFASTLDGRSAAADGSSQWITGEVARADVHRLRAFCDTVLVGTGTVLADDPRLTVRDGDGVPAARELQPLRAVMGLRDVPPHAAVRDDTAATVVLETREPREALDRLFRLDRQHVWLEGGAMLAAAFLRAGLVDEVVAYVAPALLGSGRSAVADLGITSIGDARRFTLHDVARLGDDIRLTLRPAGGDR